jgi:hypothetical protein
MSRGPLGVDDPSVGERSRLPIASQPPQLYQTRRRLAAGTSGLGAVATALGAFWSASPWLGVALFVLTSGLLVVATMILFSRRADATNRLIEIIKAVR